MRKYILINAFGLLFLFIPSLINAQNVGEIWSCQTKDKANKSYIKNNPFNTEPKFVNIILHIVRRSNGTGGLSENTINNSIQILYNDFKSYNIYFIELERNYIDNTTFTMESIVKISKNLSTQIGMKGQLIFMFCRPLTPMQGLPIFRETHLLSAGYMQRHL